KIYIHWAFHRNEMAFGTFAANPYILDNAWQGDIPDAHAKVHAHGSGGEESVRPLLREREGNLVGSAREGETEELRRGGTNPGPNPGPIIEGPMRPAPRPAEPSERPSEPPTATLQPGGFGGGGGSGGGFGGGG